jgi:tellurite resistance protein|tara:strand:- start:1112 stop:1465 length:354 start_codon:yes stop_codon:yes gene_type:complete
MLRLAHNVIVSDGLLDPNEEGMLLELKQEMGLSELEELEYLELQGIQDVFQDKRSRVVVVINLIKLSYVDGAFEIEEECLLKEISRAFDISDTEFLLLDNWVRRLSALEEEAEAFFT